MKLPSTAAAKATKIGIGLILALVCSSPNGQAAITTKPQDFALYYVGRSENEKKVPPQMSLRVNFHTYVGAPSFRSFLEGNDSTPETPLARYIKTVQEAKSLAQAKGLEFYADTEAAESVKNRLQADFNILQGKTDIKFLRRYDIGDLSLIMAAYVTPDGKQRPFALRSWALRRVEQNYHLTTYSAAATQSLEMILISTIEYGNNFLKSDWNAVPKPEYKYRLRLLSSLPTDTSDPPLEVLFNGQTYNFPLNGLVKSKEPIVDYAAKVVQTYRTGSKEEWLGLWLPEDIEQSWKDEAKGASSAYQVERHRFDRRQIYLSFVIDFGPNAVVFLEDRTHETSSFDYFVFWKQGDTYKLTQGVSLPSKQSTFRNNFRWLFDSDQFQAYLRTITELARQTESPPLAPKRP